MNEGLPFIDIIILVAVAAFLILKLRSVLGKRSGHEKRPEVDPFSVERREGAEDKVIHLPNRNKSAEGLEEGDEDFAAQGEAEGAAGDSPGAGLTRIKLADRSFEEDGFLEGARAAFEMIIAAFAAGDRDSLRPLLSNEVYENFTGAMSEREEREEKLETTLVGIREAEIIDASLEQKTAFVTVKFLTEQINVTRDASGEVVEGDPSHVGRITDIWTFARNTRSRDPNWVLVATDTSN